jgi:hypothetical protein
MRRPVVLLPPLPGAVEPSMLYPPDAGFHAYNLSSAIGEKGNDFLVRIRRPVPFQIIAEHSVSVADRAAGTVRVTVACDRPTDSPISLWPERRWSPGPVPWLASR